MLDSIVRPLDVGSVSIANRICRTAHGVGHPWVDTSKDLISYHEARARGGVVRLVGDAAGGNHRDKAIREGHLAARQL